MEIISEKTYRWKCSLCDYISRSSEIDEEMAVEGYKWHEQTSMRHAIKAEKEKKND